jgi:alpha-glucuronidase
MFKYRVINHWDNMDGSVERGYAGRSLFFADGDIVYDREKVESYAAMLMKLRINQICLNNVNVDDRAARLITPELLPKLAELAKIFSSRGINLLIAIEFSAPMTIGGLSTCDPLDETVLDWWKKQTDIIYSYIPDLAGFLVKADSEFRTGPAALGRTQAEGANLLARAVKPHGGIIYWRCFVYNCQQDWRDTKTDRVAAAYNHFKPLDGAFDDNVILQIKNGPVDFQVREPLSPLLGALEKTRSALELQITQEYTGLQIDLFSLAVLWEEVFDSPVNEHQKLRDICGKDEKIEALCGVSNVGNDTFLCGNPLAEVNLYAFGRYGMNPCDNSEDIHYEWIREKFGKNIPVLEDMLYRSRFAYENYTSPLGLGWMVTPHYHYGPSPDGYDYSKWGTYHRAHHTHIGVERGKNGTNSVSQYHPYLAKLYNDPATTPEELLLFFHRLPYSYRLRNHKTLLQHIYDTHFEGYDEVEYFVGKWKSLEHEIPPDIYAEVLRRFALQLENAREWRDIVNTYFYRLTGIPDEKGRLIYE